MDRAIVARHTPVSSLMATRVVKPSLMAAVSCLALTGAVAAADLRAPVPVKAPPTSGAAIWAGPYLGINGGAVWHRLSTDAVYASGDPHDSARTTGAGGTFGGQVGYNWQAQNFVYGLEADLNWVSARGSDTQGPPFFTVEYWTKMSWLATARARAGLASGRTLVYGTGGLAIAQIDNRWSVFNSVLSIESGGTRTGWTAGGGVEHVINNSNVTVKAEALYVDVGGRTQETQDHTYRARFKNTAVVGRLGVNLKW